MSSIVYHTWYIFGNAIITSGRDGSIADDDPDGKRSALDEMFPYVADDPDH